jgi:heme-degrading monooxygenase HmoA
MFVTVLRYRAKAGEEDAIIALHEDWQRNQQFRARGYLSGELLRSMSDSCEFIALMRFESQEAAQLLASDPQQDAWYQRLVSFMEGLPILIDYKSEWSSTLLHSQ